MKIILKLFFIALLSITSACNATEKSEDIVHDAEYYILEAQNGERWAADDKTVDAKLAEFTKRNGGKPPNIVYILVDDIGFGDPMAFT